MPDLKLIPVGYGVAIIGLITLGIGGPTDLIWHSAYGFEVGVDAIYIAAAPDAVLRRPAGSSTGIRSMWAKQDIELDFKGFAAGAALDDRCSSASPASSRCTSRRS